MKNSLTRTLGRIVRRAILVVCSLVASSSLTAISHAQVGEPDALTKSLIGSWVKFTPTTRAVKFSLEANGTMKGQEGRWDWVSKEARKFEIRYNSGIRQVFTLEPDGLRATATAADVTNARNNKWYVELVRPGTKPILSEKNPTLATAMPAAPQPEAQIPAIPPPGTTPGATNGAVVLAPNSPPVVFAPEPGSATPPGSTPVAGTQASLTTTPPTPAAPLTPADVVKNHRANIVFTKTPDGDGCGFIASYGTGTYLLASARTAARGKGVAFKTLEGAPIQTGTGTGAVAAEHDLLLLSVRPNGSPLQILTRVEENAKTGDGVVILGNKDGMGVISATSGRITGISPTRIDIDIPFQEAESGTPIIHLKTGKVIAVAVATMERKYGASSKDLVKKQELKRTGYRVDSVKTWQPLNWQTFNAQAAELEAIEKQTTEFEKFIVDFSKNGIVDRTAFGHPAIKNRIDAWLAIRAKTKPRTIDAIDADRNILKYLKTATQIDFAPAQQRLSYDFFQRGLAEQKPYREALAELLEKMSREL